MLYKFIKLMVWNNWITNTEYQYKYRLSVLEVYKYRNIGKWSNVHISTPLKCTSRTRAVKL